MSSQVKTSATKHMTQNQGLSVMKCVEAFEVISTTHLGHPFIIAWISFCLHSLRQKFLAELKSSQDPKKDPHLVPKS